MFASVFTYSLMLRSVAAFAALMVVHVLVWRWLKVRKQILWLFVIFLGVPTLVFAVGLARGSAPVESTLCYLLVFTLSSSYILFYPIVQTASPTLSMVRLIDSNRKSGGVTRDEIMARMCSDQPLQDRIKDLQNNGLIQASAGPQRLRPVGRLIAAVFYRYRQVLGLPCGEG